MAKVYVFLADGFEDIEALAPVDILRRGGVEVATVSVAETEIVTSAHGVPVVADEVFTTADDYRDADLLMLPGGMPGASNLYNHEGLREALLNQHAAGRLIAAICAAPAVVLAPLGLLDGRRATCYPGFEKAFSDTEYTAELVTEDGPITTGRGPGAALEFGYALLSRFAPESTVSALREGMIYNQLLHG